jgi:hypothetical protein
VFGCAVSLTMGQNTLDFCPKINVLLKEKILNNAIAMLGYQKLGMSLEDSVFQKLKHIWTCPANLGVRSCPVRSGNSYAKSG